MAENQTDAEHLRRQIIVLKRECAIDDAALAALERRAAALLVEAVGALGDVVADGADASSDGLAKRAAATGNTRSGRTIRTRHRLAGRRPARNSRLSCVAGRRRAR